MIIRSIFTIPQTPRFAGFLEVDTDPNSERIQIFDRKTAVLKHHQRTLGGVIKIILPAEHAVDANLMCALLDDSGEFNGSIADSVKCVLVNLNDFDIKNPLPYEPPP